MIKSIFFRALTLLGLTFVLIGCGAAEPADAGGTGTPGAAGLSAADVKAMAEEMIKNSRGKIDSANGEQVAWKILSIIKAAQPQGSCSLFSATAFRINTTTDTKFDKYENTDARFGGEGKFTVDPGSTAGVTTSTGVMAATAEFTYAFDKYSIDGNYFLSGKFKMKQVDAGTAATKASNLKMEAPADGITNELTLSEMVTDDTGKSSLVAIGKLKFDNGFAHQVQNTPAAKATFQPCGSLIGWPIAGSKVSVEAIAPVKFTKIEMAISAPFEAHTGVSATGAGKGAGTKIDMLAFLVGPKGHYVNVTG